jgi:hypothetical protein
MVEHLQDLVYVPTTFEVRFQLAAEWTSPVGAAGRTLVAR